ncbi:hypothetical protein VK70_24895 [Paenibacillus durus ATCC 35681]|uniref:Uncharacterized protein n=1 Tax=Paenibacillus durus ATCC 35681 TaxID=1333534 RepID=A0A0F7FEC0_PAEDU|nr:hypothetical protein VK70_24895 [Paenibacillus durus ATCC 35681]
MIDPCHQLPLLLAIWTLDLFASKLPACGINIRSLLLTDGAVDAMLLQNIVDLSVRIEMDTNIE